MSSRACSFSKNVVNIFQRVQFAMEKFNFPSFIFKPFQIHCLENILLRDVVAMLPTGYGKSLIYQILPAFLDIKSTRNFVIVICPLNSIIEDQINVLKKWGINAGVLKEVQEDDSSRLFSNGSPSKTVDEEEQFANQDVKAGNIDVLFTHPEALLSSHGRKLFRSNCFQENVVSLIIDEAHCVVTW